MVDGKLRGIPGVDLPYGWTDPPGYVGKIDGRHLKNLSFEKDFPLVRMSSRVPDVYRLPSGDLNPIHEDHSEVASNFSVRPTPICTKCGPYARLNIWIARSPVQCVAPTFLTPSVRNSPIICFNSTSDVRRR